MRCDSSSTTSPCDRGPDAGRAGDRPGQAVPRLCTGHRRAAAPRCRHPPHPSPRLRHRLRGAPVILSPRWWAAAIDRAIRTAAQTALATLGADQLDVLAADWPAVGSLAAGAALLSILTSIAFPPPEAE